MNSNRWVRGFVGGFVATLVFHQGMLTILTTLNVVGWSIFPTASTAPFGVPAIWSLAFWGGLWGIVLILFLGAVPRTMPDWLTGMLFGAIVPTLVAWFVVLPLKGAPVGGGWQVNAVLTALLINGAWGWGTVLFARSVR